MDPVGTLVSLVSAVNYLYEASEKVQQNKEECRRFAAHANDVFMMIQGEIDDGISPRLLEKLQRLKRQVNDCVIAQLLLMWTIGLYWI